MLVSHPVSPSEEVKANRLVCERWTILYKVWYWLKLYDQLGLWWCWIDYSQAREGACQARPAVSSKPVGLALAQVVVGSILWAFRRLKKPRCWEMSARGYALHSVCLQPSFFRRGPGLGTAEVTYPMFSKQCLRDALAARIVFHAPRFPTVSCAWGLNTRNYWEA